MNRDFVLLNDNIIKVTNENGIEANRGNLKNNNVKRILLAENKVEIVENIEEQLEKEKFENKKVIFLSNGMLKFSTIVLILSSLIGFIYGSISYPSDYIIAGFANSIYWSLSAIIPVGCVKIYFNIIKLIFKKKLKNTETKLIKTNNMKEEYEKELDTEKEKIVNITLEPLVEFSLEEENHLIAKQIEEELQQFIDENIKQRGKIRIRKR